MNFTLILFVNKLTITSSQNSRENYPRKCFWTKEKENLVLFNRLSAFEQLGPDDCMMVALQKAWSLWVETNG